MSVFISHNSLETLSFAMWLCVSVIIVTLSHNGILYLTIDFTYHYSTFIQHNVIISQCHFIS